MAFLFSFFKIVRLVIRAVKIVATGVALAQAARRYA